jgi:hypothetical protein
LPALRLRHGGRPAQQLPWCYRQSIYDRIEFLQKILRGQVAPNDVGARFADFDLGKVQREVESVQERLREMPRRGSPDMAHSTSKKWIEELAPDTILEQVTTEVPPDVDLASVRKRIDLCERELLVALLGRKIAKEIEGHGAH